jgi:hypothetical protein
MEVNPPGTERLMKRIAVVLAATIALGACSSNTCACSYGNAGPASCAQLQGVYERHHSADGSDTRDVRIAGHILDRAIDRRCKWAID